MSAQTIFISRMSSSSVRGVAGSALRNFCSSITNPAIPQAYSH